MVMELAISGSLQHLLRQQRHAHSDDDLEMTAQRRHDNLTSADLVLFAVHVASGMEYVASQRVRYSCKSLTVLQFVENRISHLSVVKSPEIAIRVALW